MFINSLKKIIQQYRRILCLKNMENQCFEFDKWVESARFELIGYSKTNHCSFFNGLIPLTMGGEKEMVHFYTIM